MTERKLRKEAKKRYPIGCEVDQRNAYNGHGNTYTITSHIINYDYGNLSIDGIGVYDSNIKIWAEIISYPEGYNTTKDLLKELVIW